MREWEFICIEECVRYFFFLWGLGTMQGNAFKMRKQHGLVLDWCVGRVLNCYKNKRKSCCCNRLFSQFVSAYFYLFLYCDGKNALIVKDAQLCGCHYFFLSVFPSLNSIFIGSWVAQQKRGRSIDGGILGSDCHRHLLLGANWLCSLGGKDGINLSPINHSDTSQSWVAVSLCMQKWVNSVNL